jgi:hypothetical protein
MVETFRDIPLPGVRDSRASARLQRLDIAATTNLHISFEESSALRWLQLFTMNITNMMRSNGLEVTDRIRNTASGSVSGFAASKNARSLARLRAFAHWSFQSV